ncbi:MAG TPA: TonB-dependent receptor [Vicinamibacterales bacterium]|nr:TonB-dependent receptor [Vicinamibacterales bacterium]
MGARLTGLITAAAIVGLTAVSVSAQTKPAKPLFTPILQGQQARLTLGSIQGIVSDERGGPLAGAMVSALGVTTAMATTDARGRFLIQPLPSGQYILRVHLPGFVSTRRDGVRVSTMPTDVSKIQMRRLDDGSPLVAHPILTAGIEIPSGDNPTTAGDNHTETAWRLRHIARSVLKQDGDVVSITDAARGVDDDPVAGTSSIFGRAFDNAANLAASFFTATPFSGEVNFLTTSALGTGPMLFTDFVPRGVAYMSIGAPAASGRWDVRASMSQSDVSAWILAGTFSSHIADSHDYGFGVSYSTQQYQNTRSRPLTLGSANDDTRNVGEIHGSDRWTLSPEFSLDYGMRYARYDYLQQHSLFSPRIGFAFTPYENTHVTANVGQRMLAPGAEEFLPPATVGPWLPPERTFAPLEGENLRVERTQYYDVGLAHEFDGTYVLGVRRFQHRVDDQLVTLFGLPVSGGPKSPGHYAVASAGAVDADGWGFRLSNAPKKRIRGSVDYTITHARWVSRGDMAAIAMWAPSAIRPHSEDVHDLTTSLETDVPITATRVFVLYKINSGFARGDDPTRPALDYRFDVQVNQALPFMPFSGTARWEVLVGLRNLFRDANDSVSVYDELLVVRPPKRVIGGVLIRF